MLERRDDPRARMGRSHVLWLLCLAACAGDGADTVGLQPASDAAAGTGDAGGTGGTDGSGGTGGADGTDGTAGRDTSSGTGGVGMDGGPGTGGRDTVPDGPRDDDAGSSGDDTDAGDGVDEDAGSGSFECPRHGVMGSGRHRLFAQGHGGASDVFGVYPLFHDRDSGDTDAQLCDDAVYTTDDNGDGVWQPGEEPLKLGPSELVHGEHFLVGAGSYAEFSTVLCDDITGDVTFYVPNYDESGSRALHQLFVVRNGVETLIAQAVDDEAGQNGYNPFVRQVVGVDPDARAGDRLLWRATNLNGIPFSVMVWYPPSDYESWVLVEVP